MMMSTWVIISWVLVAVLTGINIFVFLKLKGASEQMLKMAFPNAKNMGEAMEQMQKMMGNLQKTGFQGMGRGQGSGTGQRLETAMQMLQKMQKNKSNTKSGFGQKS